MAALLRKLTIGLSALAYIVSLFLPFATDHEFGWFPGFAAFFAAFAFWTNTAAPGLFFVVWLANPVYWVGIYLLDYERPIFAAFAGVLSLSLAMLDIARMAVLCANHPAYWVWLGSFAAFAFGSFLCVAIEFFNRSTNVSDQRLGLAINPITDDRIQQ